MLKTSKLNDVIGLYNYYSSNLITNMHSSTALIIHCIFLINKFKWIGIYDENVIDLNAMLKNWLNHDEQKYYCFKYEDLTNKCIKIKIELYGLYE
jgi:hypothetical protein